MQTILVLKGPSAADASHSQQQQAVRDACATRCEQYGLALDFCQFDDADDIVQQLENGNASYCAVLFEPVSSGNAEAPAIGQTVLRTVMQRQIPIVEVRQHNIFCEDEHASEPLRDTDGHVGFVCGFGAHGFALAIDSIAGNRKVGSA